MPGPSWEDLRRRLERLAGEVEVADLMAASENSGIRLYCFNALAISLGEAFDLARRLADEARESGSGEVP
jgi:hypothetical protein